MKILLLGGSIFIAILLGLALALFGQTGLMVVMPLMLGVFVLLDYRVGLAFVAIVLPFISSPLLPQARGLNPINYAMLGALVMLALNHFRRPRPFVMPPRAFVICLLMPMLVGGALAIPHLPEAARNFAAMPFFETFTTANYVIQTLVRPLQLFLFAVLLANAVRDSARPERFVTLFAVAVVVPVVVIGGILAVTRVPLGPHRIVVGDMAGLHYNSLGALLAFGFAPMLYVAHASKGWARVLYGGAAALVALGVALTFTRAAYLAVVVSLVFFAIQKRTFKVVLGMVLLTGALLAVAPDAVLNRALTGLDQKAVATAGAGRMDDKLTAGRFGAWEVLAPDILLSPVWGRGTGSTGWSTAMSMGQYDAGHPHNMFLMSALDVGLLGLGLLLYMYWRTYTTMRKLARHEGVHPRLRGFFEGSAVAFVCFMIIGMTNGAWYPVPEQTFMWFAMGVLFAHWRLANPPRQRVSAFATRPSPRPDNLPGATRA